MLASRCRAGPSKAGGSSVLSDPPEPAPHAADQERRFRARAAARPQGHFSAPGAVSDVTQPSIRPFGAWCTISRQGALCASPGRQQATAAAMPPLFLDGPTLDAPNCVADPDPRSKRTAVPCFRAITFGAARRVAIRPSTHPRIRWTVASPGGAIGAHGESRPPPSRVPICPTRC